LVTKIGVEEQKKELEQLNKRVDKLQLGLLGTAQAGRHAGHRGVPVFPEQRREMELLELQKILED
jgi:hypothetical protein